MQPCSETSSVFIIRAYRAAVWHSRQNFRYVYGWLSRSYAEVRTLTAAVVRCSLWFGGTIFFVRLMQNQIDHTMHFHGDFPRK
jgi:hypothetical protein